MFITIPDDWHDILNQLRHPHRAVTLKIFPPWDLQRDALARAQTPLICVARAAVAGTLFLLIKQKPRCKAKPRIAGTMNNLTSTTQSIKSINQSRNQSINQPTNPSISQSVINQSTKSNQIKSNQTKVESNQNRIKPNQIKANQTNQSIIQSINQPTMIINQPANQSINQSMKSVY